VLRYFFPIPPSLSCGSLIRTRAVQAKQYARSVRGSIVTNTSNESTLELLECRLDIDLGGTG